MAYPTSLNWSKLSTVTPRYFNDTFKGTIANLREDRFPYYREERYTDNEIKSRVYEIYCSYISNGLILASTDSNDSCINLICGSVEGTTYKISLLLWGLINGNKDYLYNYDFMIMQATGFRDILVSEGIDSIETTSPEPSRNTEYFHKEWPGLELFESIEIIKEVIVSPELSYATRHFRFK